LEVDDKKADPRGKILAQVRMSKANNDASVLPA
jgi:hypothetical protein